MDVGAERDHHDLVRGLQHVDEVAQRLRHLLHLLGHAGADVQAQGDPQGPPLSAEVGDRLLLPVLADLEVLTAQAEVDETVDAGEGQHVPFAECLLAGLETKH